MKSSYALGLFYIFTVSIIWSAASILVQYLYEGLDFDSPFLLTYIGTSLFIILIPGYFICNGISNRQRRRNRSRRIRRRGRPGCCCLKRNSNQNYYANNDNIHTSNRHNGDDEYEMEIENNDEDNDDKITYTSTEGTPLSQHQEEKFDEQFIFIINDPREDGGEDGEEINQLYNYHEYDFMSQLEHLRMAAKIAPWWFISNYFYNMSLKYTTITSSTVLASTGSIFTFLFSLIWGDETFHKSKLFGVLLSFLGSFITSLNDANSSSNSSSPSSTLSSASLSTTYLLEGENDTTNSNPFPYQIWGDVAGLISAMGYGVYTVLVRILCHDENKMSINLFLGYVGVLNMIILSPIAIWSITNITKGEEENTQYYDESYISSAHLTWFVLFCLVIKGLFDNVLSDYLWAKSIVLTSATVATVGLGLTIPLALLSDLFIMKRTDVWTLESIGGATLVLAGFVFVNLGEQGKDDDSDSVDENFIETTVDEEISMSLQ